jgi:hypothetical protein
MSIRELLDAVFPTAQTSTAPATPAAPVLPVGTIPRKKRTQMLLVGGVVVVVLGFFLLHRPEPKAPVMRSRSQNTPPTTTLTPEQITQSSQQLADSTRAAIQQAEQLKNLSVAQFGNDPVNTGLVDPNTGQRMNPSGQDAANYQTQAQRKPGRLPSRSGMRKRFSSRKLSMRVRTFHQRPWLVTRNQALLRQSARQSHNRTLLPGLQRGLRPPWGIQREKRQ